MKSKFSQFEAMLEDPKSEKYKVKTEDDITVSTDIHFEIIYFKIKVFFYFD
jgi:hypothetical protein